MDTFSRETTLSKVFASLLKRSLFLNNLGANSFLLDFNPFQKRELVYTIANGKTQRLFPLSKMATNIRPILLKELRVELAPIIKVIFERSLQTGKLPADWCKANVTPIFKKGDKSLAANYCPISLTCILCKVLKHILASNIVGHLDE